MSDLAQRRPGRRRASETDEDLIARLAAQYPSVALESLASAFQNPHQVGAVVQDLVKVAVPRRAGQERGMRSMPDDPEVTANVLADMRGDYSMDPFLTAFGTLAGHHSLNGVVARTGLERTQVQRLRTGRQSPTCYEMEQIAAGYRRSPLYFTEYRVAVLVAMLATNLTPEQTAAILHKLRRAR